MKDFLTLEKGNQSIHLAAVSEILFISHNQTSQVCLVEVNMKRFEFIYFFVTLEKYFFHPISGRKSSPLPCLPLKTCEIFKGNDLNMLVFFMHSSVYLHSIHTSYDSILTIKPLLLNHQILQSLLVTIFVISQLHKAMEIETQGKVQ